MHSAEPKYDWKAESAHSRENGKHEKNWIMNKSPRSEIAFRSYMQTTTHGAETHTHTYTHSHAIASLHHARATQFMITFSDHVHINNA